MKRILQELTKLFETLLGFPYSEDIELQDSWSISSFKQTFHVNFHGFEVYIELRFSSLEHYSEIITPDFQRALNTVLYEIMEVNWDSTSNKAEYRLYKEQRADIQ
jgi:hypothetical protein